MTVMAPNPPTCQPPQARDDSVAGDTPAPDDSADAEDPRPARDHRAVLPADPRSVAEARRQVRAAVRYWRLPADSDVAALCVSELVTNAVTHDGNLRGKLDTITLTIRGRDGQLRVDVHDHSPQPPVLNGSVPDSAEGGRGLLLIDSLATAWGSYRTATGKAVFFTL